MLKESIENTTLALQHYYDVKGVMRKTRLATVYSATEQPYGRSVNVWVFQQLHDMHPPKHIQERLENTFLKARKVLHPACARILDYGNLSDGALFIVLDETPSLSLDDWIHSCQNLSLWQTYRIVEQLASLAANAHKTGLEYLALSPENIYVTDEKRCTLAVAPLGLGLFRSELLEMEEALISVDIVKHIPPWEFAKNNNVVFLKQHETIQGSSINNEENLKPRRDDSIQDVDDKVVLENEPAKSKTNAELYCPDLYAIATIAYLCLTGTHPYFRQGCDVSDAVLSMLQDSPPHLDENLQLPQGLSEFLLKYIQEPLKGPESFEMFVRTFRSFVPQNALELAQKAQSFDQSLDTANSTQLQKQRRNPNRKVSPSIRITATIALLLLTALLTWSLASLRKPVELFNLPEILPQDIHGDGVDVVVLVNFDGQQPLHLKPEIYLTTLTGELLYLGDAPYVLKNQQVGAKLGFVVSAEGFQNAQPSLVVQESQQHVQVLQVTLFAKK